jgi:hypothetical protein
VNQPPRRDVKGGRVRRSRADPGQVNQAATVVGHHGGERCCSHVRFSTLRSLAFMSVISCGLITAVWSGARAMPRLHDQDRGDVVWIDTDHR